MNIRPFYHFLPQSDEEVKLWKPFIDITYISGWEGLNIYSNYNMMQADTFVVP